VGTDREGVAWLGLLLIVVAFGGLALAFGWSERAEERRILAWAEAVLARGAISYVVPEPDEAAEPAAADEPRAAGRDAVAAPSAALRTVA
jgi:hypothetical protein